MEGIYLVRMLDVHAEAELLQDPPLRLDHLVLQRDVGPVQDHGLNGPAIDLRITFLCLFDFISKRISLT